MCRIGSGRRVLPSRRPLHWKRCWWLVYDWRRDFVLSPVTTGTKKPPLPFYLTRKILGFVRRHGISEGSPGVVSDTVRKLQRCGNKGHVLVLSGRVGVLCHYTSLQTRADVSNLKSDHLTKFMWSWCRLIWGKRDFTGFSERSFCLLMSFKSFNVEGSYFNPPRIQMQNKFFKNFTDCQQILNIFLFFEHFSGKKLL